MFEFEKNDVKTARKWFEMGCKAENPQEKLEYYSKTLKINPNHISAWNNKGVALRLLGKFEKAIECFDKALKIDPKDKLALKNREIVMDKLAERKIPDNKTNPSS
ncbi:MAG: tetratricopeptide repeat protein [Candidatus Wukongarchaeota archaeon]|jgi:tetratricopeptide (TPR) repeat protein|nr:tetratricopeptide repeat protein [Candidatus Wukongarchaeota archaeon]